MRLPQAFHQREAAARKAAKKLGLDLCRSHLLYWVFDSNNQDVLASELSLTEVEDLIKTADQKVHQMPLRRTA